MEGGVYELASGLVRARDRVHPRLAVGVQRTPHHARRALGHIELDGRRDAPRATRHIGVVARIVRLHPEAELKVIA